MRLSTNRLFPSFVVGITSRHEPYKTREKKSVNPTLLCRKVTARPVTFEDTMRIGRIFPISHIIIRIFVGTVLQ